MCLPMFTHFVIVAAGKHNYLFIVRQDSLSKIVEIDGNVGDSFSVSSSSSVCC